MYTYVIIYTESEVTIVIEFLTSMNNLISSLLALITAIIAYRLSKH